METVIVMGKETQIMDKEMQPMDKLIIQIHHHLNLKQIISRQTVIDHLLYRQEAAAVMLCDLRFNYLK